MSEIITCTPRTLPVDRREEAARVAREINPYNYPAVEALPRLARDLMPTPQRIAVMTKKYWGIQGKRFTVGFLDNPPQALRTRILSHMSAWNKTANVEFVETAAATQAEVRINRDPNPDPDWDGYWSFLGTDILVYSGPNNQTMNLQGFTMNTDDAEFYRVVRHEAGHTLGFPHEHMRKALVDTIDREKAIAYYMRTQDWTEEEVIAQVLTPLEESSILGTPQADPNSIMCYQIPGFLTRTGQPIVGGLDIDQSDYNFVASIYPKR